MLRGGAAAARPSRRTGCAASGRRPGCHPAAVTARAPIGRRPRPAPTAGSRRWIRLGAMAVGVGRHGRPDRGRRRRTRRFAGWIGPRTRVVDLRGRTVTPGFGDAHVHPVSSGRRAAALRPDRASRPRPVSRRDRVVRGGATRMRPGSAVAAGRWPTSRAASRPAPISTGSRPIGPVYLESRDGHAAWVNGRALELAGIDGHDRRPARRPDRARRERRAVGHAPGGGPRPRRQASSRRRRPTTSSPGSGSPRPSSTRSGSRAGRTPTSGPRRRTSRTRRWPAAAS